MGTEYHESDAKRDTGVSRSEASQAWHQAREDARASGHLNDKPAKEPSKNADREPTRSEYSDRLTGGKLK